MSERRHPGTTAAKSSGRHRPSEGHGRRPVFVVSAVVLPLAVVAGLIALFLLPGSVTGTPAAGGGPSSGADGARTSPAAVAAAQSASPPAGCPLPAGRLAVTAAPEIAPTIRRITAGADSGRVLRSCRVEVTAQGSVDSLRAVLSEGTRPDVWIPDSSVRVAEAARAGVRLPANPTPVAVSPVVLAVAPTTASRIAVTATDPDALQRILATRSTGTPVRIGLPDPATSASAAALVQIRDSLAARADGRAALTWALRSTPADLPGDATALLNHLTDDPGTAVPVTEQSVFTHNRAAGTIEAVPAYLPGPGAQLDYPYVVAARSADTGRAAGELLALLTGDVARRQLADDGFRDPDGHFRQAPGDGTGVDPADRSGAVVPRLSAVEGIEHSVAVSNEPSRTLAILDVSGSMSAVVPGSGGASRLDLAKAAAQRGLALYPPDSEVGLWVFSRDLTPTTDYRELVPVGPLSGRTGGRNRAEQISDALATVEVDPDGGTGLYDTTLSAVRALRAKWDPARVNTVLILSDGTNDDQGSVSLPQLLETLSTEQDTARPVPVITIAFGPDSDVDALNRISRSTGGAGYVAQDPQDIGEIFLDAVGQRLCRPNC